MRVLNEMGLCPICESKDIDYDSIQSEEDMAYFPWTCNKCGTTGEEWYSMDFSGHSLNIENDFYELPYINDEIIRAERLDKGVITRESDGNIRT